MRGASQKSEPGAAWRAGSTQLGLHLLSPCGASSVVTEWDHTVSCGCDCCATGSVTTIAASLRAAAALHKPAAAFGPLTYKLVNHCT